MTCYPSLIWSLRRKKSCLTNKDSCDAIWMQHLFGLVSRWMINQLMPQINNLERCSRPRDWTLWTPHHNHEPSPSLTDVFNNNLNLSLTYVHFVNLCFLVIISSCSELYILRPLVYFSLLKHLVYSSLLCLFRFIKIQQYLIWGAKHVFVN